MSGLIDVRGLPIDQQFVGEGKPDVLVGIPLHGLEVFLPFYQRLNKCLHYTAQHGIRPKLAFVASSLLTENRNGLCREAIKCGARWLMTFDSDQLFDEDIIIRFIEHKVPVVGALYVIKAPPFRPLMYAEVEDREYASILKWTPGSIVEVDAMGMGACLIETGVLEKCPKPWFACPPMYLYYDPDRKMPRMDMERWTNKEFDHSRTWGEDVWFCHLLSRTGVKMYVDTGAVIGHIGTHVFDTQEYELHKDEQYYKDELVKHGEKVCRE